MLPKKYYILLLIGLLLIATPFESFFTIQSPGWHTIIPATSYLEVFVFLYVLIITSIYWRISSEKINIKLFFFHFIFCLPIVIYARFNHLLRHFFSNHTNDTLVLVKHLTLTATISFTLFLIAQIFFISQLKGTKKR